MRGGEGNKTIYRFCKYKKIRQISEYYPIDGVTTNPSIIVKEERPFIPLLKEIQCVLGDEKILFVQTIAQKAEKIVKEAIYIRDFLSGNVVIKIPVTKEGIKAIRKLSLIGVQTLATTVYTPLNAYLAAKAGASYVAPYVNRIDNLTGNGVQVVKNIVEVLSKEYTNCKVLAASFKNTQQILDVSLIGSHGVTASPDIIDEFLNIPTIEANVNQFRKEWFDLYGSETFIE
ncbi:transaldolase [Gracilibacillus boraciitolerans JCM 21714]|uniref:Transaldolase n=1 Tax=Gracilibacillus boraciitolerans JCM 21714 TaxID=1298598 RepID=W4VIU7_9BACI|nr:transaldolase family protein [Gracilibacillus boraciitolerans]GAE93071.1 transaldolase [Gracilibacillus boraciitolerans JCM 21714]